MIENELTNWYEWDDTAKKWSFQKTKDHIFAGYHQGGKRIGDMAEDELIRVIATGYHERERLALALVSLLDGGDLASVDFSIEIANARLIVDRLKAQ